MADKLIDCPFSDLFDASGPDCVYYNLGFCSDIEIDPKNGDAWCLTMIDKGMALDELCKRFSE